MSDIGIDLPIWVVPVLYGAIYWPVTLFSDRSACMSA